MSITDQLHAAIGHLRAVDLGELSTAQLSAAMAASTQAWLAQSSGVSHRDASRELKLAKELQTTAPQTREAMSRPGMSSEKARVITGAMGKLPRRLNDGERTRVEADLVERARSTPSKTCAEQPDALSRSSIANGPTSSRPTP